MTNALTTYDAFDRNIGTAALDGDLLRFNGKTGKFIRGSDKIELPNRRRLKLAPTSVQDGFVRWENGRITDQRFREWVSNSQPIERDDLGDNNELDWPDGKDPWSFTLMVAFKDGRGIQLKFTTSSTGGCNAVRKVLRDWRAQRQQHEGEVPVVELGTDSYEHKVHRTTITVPTFTIVGWTTWDGEMPIIGNGGGSSSSDIPF
jgi:hypothetical protein